MPTRSTLACDKSSRAPRHECVEDHSDSLWSSVEPVQWWRTCVQHNLCCGRVEAVQHTPWSTAPESHLTKPVTCPRRILQPKYIYIELILTTYMELILTPAAVRMVEGTELVEDGCEACTRNNSYKVLPNPSMIRLITFLPFMRFIFRSFSLARWQLSLFCPMGSSTAGAPRMFSSIEAHGMVPPSRTGRGLQPHSCRIASVTLSNSWLSASAVHHCLHPTHGYAQSIQGSSCAPDACMLLHMCYARHTHLMSLWWACVFKMSAVNTTFCGNLLEKHVVVL